MSRDARAADRYERIDHVVLGPREVLLVVAAVGGEAAGQRFFVPVRTGGPAGGDEARDGDEGRDGDGGRDGDEGRGGDEGATAGLAAVRRMLAGTPLRTARGGVLEFRRAPGAPAGEVRRLPFEQGWSSNALSLVAIGGVPHIHKTYRRLDETVREPELLRRLSGTGRTPEWAGDYTYTDPVRGTRHPLGVVYRHAPGRGIDVPLRENLRSLWPRLAAGSAPEPLVRAHLRPLERNLRAAGSFLRAFHRDLSVLLGAPATGYPVGEALEHASVRLAGLARAAAGSAGLAGALAPLPPAARGAAFAALEGEVAALREAFAGRDTAPGAGPCHGDLHLSHLLCGEQDTDGAPWRMSVIDLSTPAMSPDDPAYAAQSPLQDLVAVQRALEYFAADEAAFESARRLGIDATLTMYASLETSAHTGGDHPRDLGPARQKVVDTVFRTADTWRAHVLRLLLGPAPDGPLRRLLYLRRLLHELGYNHDHARPYHAAIDLRHALAQARDTSPTHPAPTTPART